MLQRNTVSITAVSVLIPVVVAILFTVRLPNVAPLIFYPHLCLHQCIDRFDLVIAYVAIRQKKIKLHEKLMKTAIALSILFGHVRCLSHDFGSHSFWWGGVVNTSTISSFFHIILSIGIIPMVLITYVRAISKRFADHKKISYYFSNMVVHCHGVVVFMISPYY